MDPWAKTTSHLLIMTAWMFFVFPGLHSPEFPSLCASLDKIVWMLWLSSSASDQARWGRKGKSTTPFLFEFGFCPVLTNSFFREPGESLHLHITHNFWELSTARSAQRERVLIDTSTCWAAICDLLRAGFAEKGEEHFFLGNSACARF